MTANRPRTAIGEAPATGRTLCDQISLKTTVSSRTAGRAQELLSPTQGPMRDPRPHAMLNLEAAASSMADAILTIDEEGCVVYASPAVRELLGYEPDELVGGPLTVIIPEDLRQRHAEGFARYLTTGRRGLDWVKWVEDVSLA